MKRLKILFDYSPMCRQNKTGIPVFVKNIYAALEKIEDIQIEKTFCFCKYIPSKPWKMYRFFEQVLYHNIYLPFKLSLGNYDVYVENQYMFTPLFKPKNTTIVTILYDISLALYDTLHTQKHTDNWRNTLIKSIANSDMLLTISQSSKYDIEAYLKTIHQNSKPVEYIYLDTDTLESKQDKVKDILKHFKVDKEYFLFLGTLEPRKNTLNLVKAFHIFKAKSGSNIKLIFAGKKGWLYEDVMQYAKTHHLESEVIFTGYVSDEEKVVLLQHAKAFVFLSLYEGFGIPILEALRLNVPCLLSDIPVFHELFGDNVLYTPHDNIDTIAEQMQNILSTAPTIDKKTLEQFSWYSSAHSFVNLLRKYENLK